MLSAAIIPTITSLFGGTRIQASGPTAPMTKVMSTIIVAIAADNSGIPQKFKWSVHNLGAGSKCYNAYFGSAFEAM